MSKPVIVFLCHRIPYPPIKGERITTFNLLRHLTRGYRVFLGTFIDDPADRAGIPFLQAMVEDLFVSKISRPWSYLVAFPRWLAGQPISFGLFRSVRLAAWMDKVERLHRPVAIVTHSSNISGYAVDRFQRVDGTQPLRILHFADVDSEKFTAYAERVTGLWRWIYATESRRVRREEIRLAAAADAVAFVSDEESRLFRSVLGDRPARIVTLPNGVDTELFDPTRYPLAPFEGKGATFAFTGAMDYPPNVEAATWFAAHVFPTVRAALPDAQFLIIGAKPAAAVAALARRPGITVTGKVDSVAAYLAHAQAAVAPLQIARGVQNKVLEAMAMAKPVVASTGAMTGIAAQAGEHLLCANTPAEWVDACVRLIREPDVSRRIGDAARALVLESYAWEAQFARLDAMLSSS